MSFKREDIEKIYNTIRVKHNTGKNASYIPELKDVDPNIYAISICDIKGHIINVGDSDKKVAIESVSKVFSLILALNKYNVTTLLDKIGSLKEIGSFNSLEDVINIKNHTINSFVNAGAMATTSLLYKKNKPDKEKEKETETNVDKIIMNNMDKMIKKNMEDFAGEKLELNNKVYISEMNNNQHNIKLVKTLMKYNRFYGKIETIIECYTKQCSYMVSSKNIAVMAAAIANYGVNPITKKKLTSRENATYVIEHMAEHGMYNQSPAWWKETCLPAKSGVGGIIMIVIPGVMGIGIVSPPLNTYGNSKRGVDTGKMLANIPIYA
jgi:glutaminase